MVFHTASLLGHFSFHRHEGLESLWHGVPCVEVSEALHYSHLRELDLQTVPKMMRGSLMRHLDVFTKLRRLVFGSSTGDMTIHITKVVSSIQDW